MNDQPPEFIRFKKTKSDIEKELIAEVNSKLLKEIFLDFTSNGVRRSFTFDNGEYDFEAMARHVICTNNCYKVFEQEIKKIYPDCMTDEYLIRRGLY